MELRITKNTIRNYLSILRDFCYKLANPPTREEEILIADLQQNVRLLPKLVQDKKIFDPWAIHREKIRNSILFRDPRFFLSWPEIGYTMFHNARIEELEYLKKLTDWNIWEKYITESSVGHPEPYKIFPASSGNLIHHAYTFSLFVQNTKFDFKNARTIFEFGGGYGNMARLAHRMGFRGTYIIFDLPEFSLLQQYYLKSLDIGVKISLRPTAKNNTVVLLSSMDDLRKMFSTLQPDLIIGCWSLSESPISLREDVLKYLIGSPSFLIAFQSVFEEVNNLRYFEGLSDRYQNMKWSTKHIEHLPNNYYLFGFK
jgi:hypothetical protein